ncbi:MAG: ABC transporter substrate-binding protein [Deltaproteobacteria bacterium]|nr:ABC transporter substrate-binding protein [Deltaproteobacteria bacterium]
MNPNDPIFGPFFLELRRLGYVDGQNIVVQRYSGEGRTERYAQLARDVVRAEPDLIFTTGVRMLLLFKAATATIPIVGTTVDPIAIGLVGSVAQPGGNITGISVDAGIDVHGKRLEILKEAVPTMSKVGFLTGRASWEGPAGMAVRRAAGRLGMSLRGSPLENDLEAAEYRRVFAVMFREGVDGLVVEVSPGNFTYRRLIIELSEHARIPAIYGARYFVDVGGLLAYGYDVVDTFRRAAGYVDLILKGAKPGALPFYQATKFELVINMKTARALGLTISPSLLARADEVIE